MANSPTEHPLARPSPSSPIEVITSPFVRFAKMGAAGGIVLLVSTIAALVWSNSPWHDSYHQFFETDVTIGFGKLTLSENRHEWINDGLMSLFFFLVGLEIKREFLVGELSSLKRAAFPFMAAVGGVIVPAVLFLTIARDPSIQRGWATSIATDVAFTLGLITFFGSRVPTALKVFVTALAIVDDIIAVLVIAIFYTAEIHYVSLAMGLAGVLVSALANWMGIRRPVIYAAIGVFVWWAVLNSGVHATIAGILLAFTIPAKTTMEKSHFVKQGRWLLDQLEAAQPNSHDEHSILHTLEQNVELVESPLYRIEHGLHPWISFLVMPLFALANAGVNFSDTGTGAITHPLSLAIFFGLFVGKPVGIWLSSFLAAKTGIATPPANLSWTQCFGAASLCGIGFTMSLFVAELAFDDVSLLSISKVAILGASLAAGIGGSVLLVLSTGSATAQETQDAA
ncbi:MAG TPA: Na+/H+ antiporter NhaA [Terracidiphilus sp.]|jgi:NhaA family Na+:H+ antiporter